MGNIILTFRTTFCLVFLAFTHTLFAQIETTEINGKSYLVYPMQFECQTYYDRGLIFVDKKEVIKRDEMNEKIVSVDVEPLSAKEKRYVLRSKKQYKKLVNNKQLIDLLASNKYILSSFYPKIDVEPTPALRALPDGDYVMYFRDIPYVKDRVLCYKNDIVCAYFSIKNNKINGKSTWYQPNGLLALEGSYVDNEKDGEWKVNLFVDEELTSILYSMNKKSAKLYESSKDSIYQVYHFKNGLKQGEYKIMNGNDLVLKGYFDKDEESGSWEKYGFKQEVIIGPKGDIRIKNLDEKYLSSRYTLEKHNPRVKAPLLRGPVIPYFIQEGSMYGNEYDSLVLTNTYSADLTEEESEFPDFSTFYVVYEPDTVELELKGETGSSYEGYEDEAYYGDEMYYDENYNANENYIYVNKKQYTMNELIDSIGYRYLYSGIIEQYYSNGQLQYRMEIKDGKLLKEEPIYWDNGKIANEILFDADSNQYVQNFYDYNGINYYSIRYNAKGNAITKSVDVLGEMCTIDGKSYYRNWGYPTFYYSSDKDLVKNDTIRERVLINEEVFKADTSIAVQTWYYNWEKKLKKTGQNLMHEDVFFEEVQFSDDFKNVNVSNFLRFDNLELRGIQNGYLSEYAENELTDTSTLEKLAYNWGYKYNGEQIHELYVNDKLFTGTLRISDDKNAFKVKARDKSISISLPNNLKDFKLYNKHVTAFLKKGKKSKLLLGYASDFGGSPYLSHSVLALFPDVYELFKHSSDYASYDLDNEGEDEKVERNKYKKSNYTSVEGRFLNGKPEGTWVYKDQYGKVRSIIEYKNGQENGKNLDYNVVYPKSTKKDEYYYETPMDKIMGQPNKEIRYLQRSQAYKNGYLTGPCVEYNWKGDTTLYVNYVEGYKQGLEINRNPILFSVLNYLDGALDGNVSTYLTLPEKDTVKLYDLNFQNGLLQGKSVAYHANGNIAKKGFFLAGQPIDDYEAYDTLGYRYQYVKFKYNQPIEEKIWEENELSVRYEFDWRDSILFNFSDITNSTSINSMLYRFGFKDKTIYEPYKGRPSLVNKTGIDYYITKYYPNDTIARQGEVSKGKKTGCWKYYNYKGEKLFEVEYFDSVIKINDSISFLSKGILYYLDKQDNPLSKSFIIEKFEKYDCSNSDHSEERMLYCFWEKDTNQHRINGYVKNYYENGNLQNEGYVKDGLPTGVWKMYDSNGNLSHVGEYVLGKRNGRWLNGDLGKVKDMSTICLNPNLDNIEEILSYQEKLIDVTVVIYQNGKELKSRYFGINRNNKEAPEGYEEEYSVY